MANQRVMPDWMYEAGPYARDFVNSLNKIMTNPGSTGVSPADLVINQTPLGSIRDLESFYKNGLNRLPPTFENAMGSDTGRAVSYGLAGMAGLGALIPMMARGGGAHPMLSPPKAPTVADFISSSPTAFGRQEPMLDVGSVSDYGLPAMLRQQAGSIGSYKKVAGETPKSTDEIADLFLSTLDGIDTDGMTIGIRGDHKLIKKSFRNSYNRPDGIKADRLPGVSVLNAGYEVTTRQKLVDMINRAGKMYGENVYLVAGKSPNDMQYLANDPGERLLSTNQILSTSKFKKE